jgi:iron(III) transport system substrate-binding protein
MKRGYRMIALGLGAALALWSGAALAQKDVVIYSANESVLDTLVFTAFEKETGIKVSPVQAGSGVVIKRVQTEKDRPQGDVVWGVSRSLLETNRGYFTPYRSKNHDAIPAEYRDPDDLWIGNNLHLLVILQNTKIVPEGQGPKSWSDLLDPKWKGKIAFTDPANSGSAYTNSTLLASLWGGGDAGWQKVEKLLGNAKVLNKSSLVFQGVGNGEYALGLSLEYAGYIWAANGAPVKVIYPEEGTVAQMEGCAIIKGGPNTENAKVFVDYINRKDVREMIFEKTFRRPARQDLDFSKLPGHMPPLAQVKLASYDEKGWTEQRAQMLQKIQDILERTR